MVSVIIPCFNAERFLVQAVGSVFKQTLKDYEIILVDDGSSDDTPNIMRSFGSRVRTEFGPHRGASAARNRGTELAQGQFIQYLDADDLLRPHALETRIQALESSGADVAYSDWQRLEEREGGQFQPGETVSRRIEDIHPDPEIALFTDFWAPPAAILYRRQIVEKIGGWNETLPIIQDARFFLDAALNGGKFVYVHGVGADYRVHGALSLSRRDPAAFVRDVFLNACQIEAWWKTKGGLTSERCAALARVYDYTARNLFSSDLEMFRENLRRLYGVQRGFNLCWPKIAGFLTSILGYRGTQVLMNRLRPIERKI